MTTPPDTMFLSRFIFTDKTTIGEVYLDSDLQCYAMEPTCRIQPGVKLAIPQGKYQIVMYDSPHFKKKVPLLLKVPGHDGVEIHPGNCLHDTHDCILPGKGHDTDWVSDSDVAWASLVGKIEEKLKVGPFYIGITGGGPEA